MPQNRYNATNKAGTYIPSLVYAIFILMVIFYFSLGKESIEHTEKNILISADDKEKVNLAPRILSDTDFLQTSSPNLMWKDHIIERGDNLSKIFKKKSLSAKDVLNLISGDLSEPLLKIKPGQLIRFGFTEDGELAQLKYIQSKLESYLYIRKGSPNGDNFFGKHIALIPRTISTFRDSTIKDSLFVSGEKASIPINIIMELANIFSWDIDFALDIRKGDQFSVLFEEKFLGEEKIAGGNILAAEFTNQGISYKAVRYLDRDGKTNYYTPEGFDMKKTFLRAQLDFTRISSNFNLRRMHPIHKKIIAHRGVDYVAPRGTPIFAVGDGKIIASNYSKANGNYIFIKHGNGITTKYLHLQKRKVKKGMKVLQTQVIGTLGSTGYSTGPHLHYEFLVNGVHRDPRKVALPSSTPIKKNEYKRFYKATKSLIAKLESYQKASRLAVVSSLKNQQSD